MAAGVTDRLWEMVDVVDVLDAFEAKRKRQKPTAGFEVERWRIGEGYYVTVTIPDSEPRRVTETFKTEGEAMGVGLRMSLPSGCARAAKTSPWQISAYNKGDASVWVVSSF